ncbi:hypothetical protein SAMN06295912_12252 [Sphingomonas laterariae]|uniref:Tyr recombinase domain-containing protein n=1 Tax=Edaphosphingomonas laterariae TaxID=861865 RepID=A0A239I907_9SPHN|nr:site-specific integrase [Sphingomonas laterariae]SNS89882.1 hypothetical protein SAMN06295912_12252 [Sphingomonas laterariae]
MSPNHAARPPAWPGPRFQILTLSVPRYSRYVLDPAGACVRPLSVGLSALEGQLEPRTIDAYARALEWALTGWAGAQPRRVARLFHDVAQARAAVAAMLHALGGQLKPSRYGDGSYHVTGAPSPVALADRSHRSGAQPHRQARRIELALIALGHVYDQLILREIWRFPNPMRVDNAAALVRREAQASVRRGDAYLGYAGRQFVVLMPPPARPPRDWDFLAPRIVEAARAWPAGLAAATALTAACGNRIFEALALTLGDWSAFDFGNRIAASNKGSHGARTKILYLPARAREALVAYVETARRAQTGVSLAQARRLAADGRHDVLATMPLFLNAKGTAISYSLFADHYFRPTMRAIGLPGVTTHRLRREHALRALLKIRGLARDKAHEAAMIAIYAEMMGWRTGAAMVDHYAPQLREHDHQALAGLLYAVDPAGRDGAPPSTVPPPPADDPRIAQFLAGDD